MNDTVLATIRIVRQDDGVVAADIQAEDITRDELHAVLSLLLPELAQ